MTETRHTIHDCSTRFSNRRSLAVESRNYYTFKRSCRNWQEFASARKFRDESNLTYDEARRRCEALNAELTAAQKRRGTKYEFTAE